ncbi:hypothetical protein B0T14DRAFT_523937 [Immersiella caudata]|uniref:FAR1 domain-containing protein n=1 Tax=Immersiella caudata TaxID=314043 RepID=A0AA39WK25_9PEZI|nr:hypothetical protein B0T14DRAFT_523937 [Immersiella caudata]
MSAYMNQSFQPTQFVPAQLPSQGQNRSARRVETPIHPPQVPQVRASPSTYQNQHQQQQQSQEQTPQPSYHTAGDPIHPPHIAYQLDALQAHQVLQQSRQNQQQQQHPQYLPQTPQQTQNDQDQHGQTAQSQDESMQIDGQDYDMESEEDGNEEGSTDANNATATEGDDGEPHMAPLVQAITPLQLPKVRPTLKLGPYDTREEAHNTVQEYAIAQGYCLVQSGCAKQKTPGGKYTPQTEVVRVDLMCDRGGTCKNIGTGKRKRPTHKLGCPTRIKLVCRKREASKWFIEIRCEEHNHDLDPRNMHNIASYRRWRRIQAGGPSTEPLKERHARTRKPKVIPPVPPPKFHQTGGLGEQPPTAPTGPVHMAALKGQAKILQILLDKGADISALDATGRTPLHCAVEGMRMDIVKLLVERGADVTQLDHKGISALHMAVEKGMEDAVVFFIENGADPNK